MSIFNRKEGSEKGSSFKKKRNYTPSPYGHGRRSTYAGYYDDFSWGSFGNTFYQEKKFQQEDENFDKDSFITGTVGYETPNSGLINDKINYHLPYEQRAQYNTEENRKFIKELSRFFYHKMMDNAEYVSEKYSDENSENLTEEEQAKQHHYKDFYSDLWNKDVGGFSPMDKAMFVLKTVAEKDRRENGMPQPQNSQGNEGDEGNDSESKSMSKMVQEQSEDMQDALETANAIGGLQNDPDISSLCEMLKEPYKSMTFEILRNMSILEDFGEKFEVEKDVEETRVQVSKEVRKEKLRSYSDIIHVNKYQRKLPNYKHKLFTKNLMVTIPVKREAKKQKIIMLVDYSGSMNMTEKQQWVLAILIDRLKYVMKGEAEIFFAFFIRDAKKYTHIHDRKSALNFMRRFSTEPNGGDTNIGDVIDTIHHQIYDEKRLGNLDIDLSKDEPEVLILNDGQDTVKTDEFSYKTNAISLENVNDELKDLCLDNNGLYVHVPIYYNVDAYSSKEIKKGIEYFGN